MFRQLALVVLSVGLERTSKVLIQSFTINDLLAFLRLRIGLSVVLAHVWIIRCSKPNDTLLALVADIYAHKHSLV